MAVREESRGIHWGVKAFVLWHLFCIIAWSLPNPPASKVTGEEAKKLRNLPNRFLQTNSDYIKGNKFPEMKAHPVRNYMNATGFWQSWGMFSPNPANVDVWIDATVTFQDGSQARFPYPRMKTMPIWKKYFKERYRKFVENTHLESVQYKWPPIGARIAYLSYSDPKNPPVLVELHRHWKEILPPPEPPPEKYSDYLFYTHTVDLKKLRSDAGY